MYSYIGKNHENKFSSIIPYLDQEQIKISNEQREPHSYQHTDLSKPVGTHEMGSNFDLLVAFLTHEAQSQQEVDSHSVNDAGSSLSHEMMAHPPNYLHVQSYLVCGVGANSHLHDKDKASKTSLHHKLERKSQDTYANSRIKPQRVTEELKPYNEASLRLKTKASSVLIFAPEHEERSPARSNKEIESPQISHVKSAHLLQLILRRHQTNAVNAVTLADYDIEPRTQLQHDT
jgi:hypothetical protein